MADMKITGLNAGQDFSRLKPGAKETGSAFDSVMQEAIGKISEIQNDAEKAVKDLASGGDVTQSIVTMQKAEMSFQMMVEIRNKLLSAYEEVMRMQV
jgi:flagellar hook-basal body complex protein FliE